MVCLQLGGVFVYVCNDGCVSGVSTAGWCVSDCLCHLQPSALCGTTKMVSRSFTSLHFQ